MAEERGSDGRASDLAARRRVEEAHLASGWTRRDREAVAALALALVEDISLEGAIQRILDEVKFALKADTVVVMLVRSDGRALDVAGARLRAMPRERLPEVSVDDSCFCARAYRMGQAEAIERLDAPAEGKLALMLHRDEGLRSVIATPLRAQRGIVGTLTLGYCRAHHFSRRDRTLTATLADVAAAAIQNARLYETTLRRERHGEIISQVLAALTATIDADQVPRRLVDVLLHAYGADRAWLLYPCDLSAPTVSVPYEATTIGYPGAHALGLRSDSSTISYLLKRALASDEPVAIDRDEPSLPEIYRQFLAKYEIQSVLAARFQPPGDRPWLVGLHQCGFRRAWTAEEVSTLAEIAGYANVAIEHAQLYQRAKEALRIRDEFISSAAHELKTPVTAMKGYAQVLVRLAARDCGLDERFRRALLAIDHSADRITRLTHDLLEVATIDTYGRQTRRTRVDLGELSRTTLADAEIRAGERMMVCRVTGSAVVFGNRDRLADVIFSLIDNAIRYSPDASTIQLDVGAEEGEALVSVHDQGLGIPEERWPHLFEPFYEPHPAGGMGYVGVVSLGLYLARRIVEEHGGRIWFETEPGVGSTFHIALPLGQESTSDGYQQDITA